MKNRMGFHGDVLFIEVNEIPKEAKKVKEDTRGYVLAEGESTGHYHAINDDIEMYEVNGVIYIKNDTPVKVTHQEHHTTTVPPGTWRIGITKEYDHLTEEERNVAD